MVVARAPRITDHALVRFLDRSGLDVEAVRAAIAVSLADAHGLALSIGGGAHMITVDGMSFVVRGDAVTTVLSDTNLNSRFNALKSD